MSDIFYPQNGPSIVFDKRAIKGDMDNWISRLNDNVDKMASKIDEQNIERTARVFMVSRNFPKQNRDNRASDFIRVVPLLKIAIDGLTADNLAVRVEKFADAMSAEPGLAAQRYGRPVYPISAASKFVWTARPDVGIIYDARARKCLISARLLRSVDGYAKYVQAFRHEKQWHTDLIERLVAHAGSPWGEKSWIADKVFDFCLYSHAGRIKA